jgi:glycosyltransferase involved in cell wall biosynthesis
MIRAAVRLPDLLIAVSDYTRREISTRFPGVARRVRVVHEGAPEPRSRSARPEEPPFFLCVGQLERSKNVEGLIAAFAGSPRLREAGVRLRIAGRPGNAYARIARLADEAGRDRVELLGYVSPETLERLYAGCLAFVLPSLVEGFGLVLLEAMAYGAPVAAMRTAAIPDVVGEAGLLVDPTDPDGLRAAMERLHADAPLRERLRSLGSERVARFSWCETARETRGIYAELVA